MGAQTPIMENDGGEEERVLTGMFLDPSGSKLYAVFNPIYEGVSFPVSTNLPYMKVVFACSCVFSHFNAVSFFYWPGAKHTVSVTSLK